MFGSGDAIKLDKELLARIRKYSDLAGYSSPQEFVQHVMEREIAKFEEGGASAKDIDTLYSVADGMMGRTICPLADAMAMPVMSFVKKFRAEFEAHADGKTCAKAR